MKSRAMCGSTNGVFVQLFAFTQAHTDLSQAYHAHHVAGLVVLSIVIAVVASFASFNHVQLIRQREIASSRHAWHWLGALSLGAGVWAMHFTGMLSYQLPLDVNYHIGLTALSVVPAILAGYITLGVIAKQQLTVRDVLTGGVLMGAGIGLMHYVGMAAMLLPAQRLYDPAWFFLSIIAAVLLATVALAVRPMLSGLIKYSLLVNLLAAFVMGSAIASMHYVAMHATVFLPLDGPYQWPAVAIMDNNSLVTLALAAVFLVLISALAVLMRFRLLRAELKQEKIAKRARSLEVRFSTIAERVPGMVYEFRIDAEGHMSFPYTSDAIRDIYGISVEQARENAQILEQIIHPDDLANVYQGIHQSAETLQPWQSEYRVIRPSDGQQRWLLGSASPVREADGGVLWSGVITDITERKQQDDKVHRLAYYDTLTSLPNRRMLYSRLDQFMQQAAREGTCGAVVFIDVDSFKRLNDARGHAAGDHLLRQLGHRLQQQLGANSFVGRLSSDEFIFIENALGDDYQSCAPQATELAARLLAALNRPFDLNGHEFQCSVSLGVCMFRHANVAADEIIKRADIAMQQAKMAGGNQWRVFDPTMQSQQQRRYNLEQALRLAVQQPASQFSLHLQPQMNSQGSITGAEALLRWQPPQLGAVSPAEFIPLLEETGMIVPIGHWVIEQASDLLRQWQHEPQFAHLDVSVNVSARQFFQPDFVQQVEAQAQSLGAASSHLVLELTESLVLEDIGETVRIMRALKATGVRFSMDDFGTGYSSLSYLATLPFDEVKIDQSFIRTASLDEQAREWIIIEAIIGLADKLEMQVIAEGVESAAEQAALQQRNCHAFQGFYFSKPLTTQDFVSFVATHRA